MPAYCFAPTVWRSRFGGRLGCAALCGLLAVTAAHLHGSEVSGTLGANTTWSSTAEPYVVDNLSGPLVVPAGVTLTVASGVRVQTKYSNKQTLSIQGVLLATGATFEMKTSASAAGGKQAIVLSGASGQATFTRCAITGVHEAAAPHLDAKLITAQDSTTLSLAGTSLQTGAVGTQPTYCGVAVLGGATVSVSSSGATRASFAGFPRAMVSTGTIALNLGNADFSANEVGIEFTSAANLSVTGCTFTGHSTALRLPQVGTLTLSGTTITNAALSAGTYGVYTEVMATFSASTTTIRNQATALRVSHANRTINVAGITFTGNTFNVYADGDYAMADVTTNTTLLPGRYIIDNSARTINVAAGATLTIQSGAIIINKSEYRDLFLVKGNLAATGVQFLLKTRAGTGRIVANGSGGVTLTDCSVTTSDTYSPTVNDSSVLRLQEQASAAVSRCTFTSTTTSGYKTEHAILAEGQAQVQVSGGGGRSSFSGFTATFVWQSTGDLTLRQTDVTDCVEGVHFLSDGNLTLDGCTFQRNDSALFLDQIGVLVTNASSMTACGRGVVFYWFTAPANTAGITLSGNTYDYLLRGGHTLDSSFQLPARSYAMDCSTGPITVPVGLTLTLPAGTALRGLTAHTLFAVQGTLTATGASFQSITDSSWYSWAGTYVFAFSGSGSGQFSGCSFTTSEQYDAVRSRLISVKDTAGVNLAGCTLTTNTSKGTRTCYGVVAEGGASVNLAASGPTQTTFTGFPVAIHFTGAGSLAATGTRIADGGQGVHLGWDTASTPMAGITFQNTTYPVHLTGPITLSADLVLPGAPYWVDASAGMVTVPAGRSLTIGSGSGFSGITIHDLLLVRGALVASGTTFQLSTHDNLNSYTGTRAITIEGSGTGQFTDCTLRASDNCSADRSDILRLRENAAATLAGCTLESTTASGYKTHCGVEVEDAAALTLAATARGGTVITGFPVGIDYRSSGAFAAAGTTVSACGWGFDMAWVGAGIDTRGITYSGNGYDVRLPGNTSVPRSLSLYQGTHAIDVTSGPVTVPAATTLTLQAGCRVINATSNLRDLLVVRGALVANQTSFDVTTKYNEADRGTRVIQVTGTGTAAFTDCNLDTRDIWWYTASRLFWLDGTATLTLAGCTLRTNLSGYQTAYGVYAEGSANLVLAASGRGQTTFSGFPTAISFTGSGSFSAAGTTLNQCSTGMAIDWTAAGIDVSNIAFADTSTGILLPGNTTITRDIVLPSGPYVFDVRDAPVTIGVGGRLAFSSGCSVTAIGRDEHRDLFVVDGRLEAEDSTFKLPTFDYEGSPDRGTRLFYIKGNGTATFSDCTVTSSDTHTRDRSRIFQVEGSGALTLNGCTLETTTEYNYQTRFGIVLEGTPRLTLAPSGRGQTTLKGFVVGIHCAGFSGFTASSTLIRDCTYGLYLTGEGMGVDASRVSYATCTYPCFVAGNYTLTRDVTFFAGPYIVDSAAGPLVVPAGRVLTLNPGASLSQLQIYDVFVVRGRIAATGAAFDLKTAQYLNSSEGSRCIALFDTATGAFTDCTFTASETNWTTPRGRVLQAGGSAQLTLSGCTFVSTATAGYRAYSGVGLIDSARLTVSASGRGGTSFDGFPCGMYLGSTGAVSLAGLAVRNCDYGIQLTSSSCGTSTAGVTFTGNTYGCHLTGGFTIGADTTIGPSPLAIETGSGPITVAAGRTLTLATGTVLTNPGSRSVFAVLGRLVAQGVDFAVTTYYDADGSAGTSILGFTGTASGSLRDCTFSTSEVGWEIRSRVLYLAGSANVEAQDCAFECSSQSSYRTVYGVRVDGAARLALTGCSFTGFPRALWTQVVPATLQISDNDFYGNTYAVEHTAAAALNCSNNWWGHPSGPKHASNPLGQGETVVGNVILAPFTQTTDLPVTLLSDHPLGQAANAFTATGSRSNALLARFALAADAATCRRLVLRLADVEGVVASALTNVRLVRDGNGDGLFAAPADTVLATGTVSLTAATVTFAAEFAAAGSYLVLADLVDLPSGATLSVHLMSPDVTLSGGVLVGGAVTAARHVLNRLFVSDHQAGQKRDGLGSAASQTGVPLLGFYLSPGYDLTGLRFDLSSIQGLSRENVLNPRLVRDSNGDGVADAGEVAFSNGVLAIAGATGTLSFNLEGEAGSPHDRGGLTTGYDFLLLADFADLRRDDRLVIQLKAAGVTLGNVGVTPAGSTLPVYHLVESPILLTDNAFQVHNGVYENALQEDVALLGCTFLPAGRRVDGLVYRLTDVQGVSAADLRDPRLVRDTNRNGQIEAGETSEVGGPGLVAMAGDTGTVTFSQSFTVQGDYILLADLASLAPDDTLTVALTAADVVVAVGDAVEGGVSPVRHAVSRPDLPSACEQHNWTLTYRSPGGLTVCGSYSPDGTQVILGYSSGAAYIFDSNSNTPLLMLHRHYDKVQYAGFSADGKLAITVSRDGGVYLWDAQTGVLQKNLFSDLLVRYAVPSPDCSKLFIVTEGKGMLLDLNTGATLWQFVQGTTQLYAADYSPDGTRILVGAADKSAYLLDAATGTIPKVTIDGTAYDLVFRGHSRAVKGATFAANGTRVLTSSSDATATLWYADDPVHPICTVDLNDSGGADQTSLGACVSRDGTRIAMLTTAGGGYTGYLRLFNEDALELWAAPLDASQFTGTMETSTGVATLAFDRAGERVLLCSNCPDNNGDIAALATQYKVADHSFAGFFGPRGRVSWNRDLRSRFSSDGQRTFFMHRRGLDLIFREPGKTIRPCDAMAQEEAFSITPDGRKLAFLNGTSLQFYAVDETRFTQIASNNIGRDYNPITLSDSGGLAIVGDTLFRSATGEVYSNSPNPDGGYRNTFSPDQSLWGIAFYGDMSIKTMRTTNDSGSLEFGVTLTSPYNPIKVLYHPDNARVGCVDYKRGVQFYQLADNTPAGLYDFTANTGAAEIFDALLSHDGTMLLIARGNSVRLYDLRTGRVLRYFYPLHSGQAGCYALGLGFGEHDNVVMITWSDNYVEMYERSRLQRLDISPVARTLPVGESQTFKVEAVYDDGSRVDVSPRYLRRHGESPVLAPGARLYAEPPAAVTIAESTVTINPGATGEVSLTAVYDEGGYTRTATATLTVGEAPLVSLEAIPREVTLTHGVVLPISYLAQYADGYWEDVTPHVTLSADQPAKVTIAGNNVTVLRSAGATELDISGSFTYRGVTRTGLTTIISHGPQSNWEPQWSTSGGDVNVIAFSPNGTRMAVGGSSGAIQLYSVGATPTQYALVDVIGAHYRPIVFLFYVSNTQMVTVGRDGAIRTWNLADTTAPTTEYNHGAVITCAAQRDGLLVFGDNLGQVLLLDLATNVLRWSQAVHTGEVRGVGLDADSVLTGGADKRVTLLKRTDGTLTMNYPGFSHPLVAVGYMGTMTYALGEDKRLVTWMKATEDDNLWEYFFPAVPSALTYQNSRLYVATETNGACATWEYDQNGLLLRWLEHPPTQGQISCLRVTPDNQYLITGRRSTTFEMSTPQGKKPVLSDFHSCQFWHLGRGAYSGSLAHSYSLSDARISQDGSMLFTQSRKRVMKASHAPATAEQGFLETGYFVPYDFAGLETSDDSPGYLAARVDESVYIMDMAARLLVKSVHAPTTSFGLNPLGTRLISSTYDRAEAQPETWFWDVAVDFPTVVHQNPVYSYDVAYLDSDYALGSIPEDEFVSIFNAAGLRFSGIAVSLAADVRKGDGPVMPEEITVARNVPRVALVVRQMEEGVEEVVWHTYVQVHDLSNRLAPVKVFEKHLCTTRDVKPRVALALSRDGSLLFYGLERFAGGSGADLMALRGRGRDVLTDYSRLLDASQQVTENDLFRGHLIDLSTARQLYVFVPPSDDTISNQGVAAAQFTQNDGALMIAWKEGYATVFERQGMSRLELSPVARSLLPGASVELRSAALYADGSQLDVTEHATLTLDAPLLANLSGNVVTVKASTPLGQIIRVTSTYREMGATKTATATLTVGEPEFTALSVDPPRIAVQPNTTVTFRFFAELAGRGSVEVTSTTAVSVDAPERVTLVGTTLTVPARAQYGDVILTGRCRQGDDERTVQAVIHVRGPAGGTTPGDFDGDRDVDFSDLTLFVGHYGETAAAPRWDQRCDLNGDASVNFNDLTSFVGLYGRTYGARSATGDAESAAAGEPLLRLFLAGPDRPVCVGDTFAVAIYAQTLAPTPRGFRGGPLDLLFSGQLVGYDGQPTPERVLAPAFTSLPTHGSFHVGRVDELGGVSLDDALDKGQPLLFAKLPCRALATGVASFQLGPGESGLVLAPPLGQLPLERIDYGAALMLTIRETNHAPTALPQALAVAVGGELDLQLFGLDPDGDPLCFAVSGSTQAGAPRGAVLTTLGLPEALGEGVSAQALRYAPQPGYSGTDVLEFSVSDGALTSSLAQVRILVGGLRNDLWITQDSLELARVTYALAPGASDALLAAEGDVAAATGAPARFVLPAGEAAAVDVRGVSAENEWRLLIDSPTTGRTPWSLSWSRPLSLPAAARALLTRVDPAGCPLDEAIDLEANAGAAVSLPAGPGESVSFTLSVGPFEPLVCEWRAGWNLVGIPFELAQIDQRRLRDRGQVRALWGWGPDGYQVPAAPVAGQGYWLFAPTDTRLTLYGQAAVETCVRLQTGWNLVAPTADSPSPLDEPGVEACYRWEPGTGYVAVNAADSAAADPLPCKRGQAYWVFSSRDNAIIWGRP